MSEINNALHSIINGKNDFCCLCFSSNHEVTIRTDDNVTVNMTDYQQTMDVAAVLRTVFGEEILNYAVTFNTLCKMCINTAISFYIFTKTIKKNVEYLTRVLDGMANSFEYVDDLSNVNSLYVSLNLTDMTSQHFYDTKKAVTPKAALKRFCALEKHEVITDTMKKIDMDEVFQKLKNEDIEERRKFKKSYEIPINKMVRMINSNIHCKKCHRQFKTTTNLKTHYYGSHAPKIFKCLLCSKKFGSPSLLKAHKLEFHTTHICSECGKMFKNSNSLKMHELSHNLSVVCQDCGRVYKNKATYKKHIDLNVCSRETRAHPSEAKFTCDYCNKKYTQKVSLRVHIQYEHGNYKSHVCEWCSKKFWAPSRLKAHIVKHTREKNFGCTLCSRKFVTKTSLLYHTRTHTGEKPYKCQYCDSRFLSSSRRSAHIKSHHNGGTYKCDVCHSKFSSKLYFKKHRRSHKKEVDSNTNNDDNRLNKKENNSNNEVKEVGKCQDVNFPNVLVSNVDLNEYNHEKMQHSSQKVNIDDTNEYVIFYEY